MKLYVDLETLELIEGPGFRNPVTSLRFKRGDAAKLVIAFLANGSTHESIGDPGTLEIRFGIKPRNRYDVGYVRNAIIGTASPVLGVITSYQEQIEWHLRAASLLVGLLVGILSLVSMVRKLRRK